FSSTPHFSLSSCHPLDLHSFPHDALPICPRARSPSPSASGRASSTSASGFGAACPRGSNDCPRSSATISIRRRATVICAFRPVRSEEHTSELQSRENLVCRLLLEKKKCHH